MAGADAGIGSAQAVADQPVDVDVLDRTERPPTYVLRGSRGPHRMVFLHGLCGYALAYLQSFQTTAASYGSMVAPQGNKLCGAGPHSTWSVDIAVIDGRIRRAYELLGISELKDSTIIGYSMGATLAERLARRWPERYTRLILIAAPDVPNAAGLGGVRSTVMMAGDHDRQDLMRRGVTAMRAAGIASTFMVLPGARHGEMGTAAERVMGEALGWLFEHEG